MTIALYIAYTYVSVVQWFLTVIKPMQLSMMFVDENDCFDNRIVSFCCKKNNCLVLSNQHGYNVFRSHPDKYMSDFRISYGQNLGLVPLKNCYGKKIISFCNIETKNKKVYVEKKMAKCCFLFSLPKKNVKYYIAISFINSLIKECIKIAKRFGLQYDFKFHPNTLSIKKDLDFCGLPIIPDFSRSSPDVFNKYDFCVFPECVSSLMILIGKQNIPCLFVNFGISNWHEHNEIYFLNISGFGPYTPDNLEHEFNNNFKDHIKRQQLYVSKYFNYDHSL